MESVIRTDYRKLFFGRTALNLYFWITFLFMPLFLSMGDEGHAEDHYNANFRAQAFFAIFYAIIIYFNNLVLIPRFFQQKKYPVYFLLIIMVIGFWAFFQAKYDYIFYGCNCLLPVTGNRFAIAGFQISSFVLAFAAFKLIRDYLKKEEEYSKEYKSRE